MRQFLRGNPDEPCDIKQGEDGGQQDDDSDHGTFSKRGQGKQHTSCKFKCYIMGTVLSRIGLSVAPAVLDKDSALFIESMRP